MHSCLKPVATAFLGLVLVPAGLASAVMASPAPAAAAAAQDGGSAHDASFLKRAIMSDRSAIDAGNIALQRTSNDRLRQIAQTVVNTHTKMLEQLEEASKASGVSVDEGTSPEAKAMCSKLEALTGTALDRAFVRDMIKLHNAELQTFRAEANDGTSESLKKLSQEQLPIIRQHLTDLHGIQKNGL